jgi:N-acetylneuraminate synthase
MTSRDGLTTDCFLVAEVAQAHDGSLGTAHAFIDAAAAAGANAIKFQTHIADAESHPSEPWRVRFSPQDDTRFEYWQRMEFNESQWSGLYSHARDAGLEFMSSPFSIEAVEMLRRTGIDRWKIASGELSNRPMLERIAADGRPVVLSSGMSPLSELDSVVSFFRDAGVELTLLQCTTAYPCPPERIGLNVMEELRSRYGVPVGLSDHSGTIYAGLAAAVLGAEMLEVHVTFSREAFGPDVPASITFDELRLLRDGTSFIATALANPLDKESVAAEMEPMRALFGRSIVTSRPIAEGSLVTSEDLVLKKPGTGIPAEALTSLVGRRVRRDLPSNTMLALNDLEDPT